tara:strand:- start:247 stop:495 length:249 start_codon:yes stop_codon:yes gene_type:complete
MAAITFDSRKDSVFGDLRIIIGTVDIAADTDTFATGMNSVLGFWATPADSSASQIGGTISGSTITFQTAGAELNALLLVIGY